MLERRPHEPRLARSGLAGDENQAAEPLSSPREHAAELRQVRVALDEAGLSLHAFESRPV